MKETREFRGKDITTAIQNACTALSVSKDVLRYDVITAGASGIFGIVGRKDAVIRVRIPAKPDASETTEEEMAGIRSIVDEAFGHTPPRPAAPAAPKPPTSPAAAATTHTVPKAATVSQAAAPAKPAAEAAMDADTDDDADGPDDDNLDDFDLSDADEYEMTPDFSDSDSDYPTENVPVVDVTPESMNLGIEVLQKMADVITENAVVTAQTDRDRLILKIEGGNAGILIGRKGQTLDAMQFLTDKIINRRSEARVLVKVDVEGYTETRKSNLRHLAFKMAEKAKKTGRPATINQMSAQDRRIVHLTLKDDAKVRTQSMGEGYYRRLVIFPKKKNSFRGKRRLRK